MRLPPIADPDGNDFTVKCLEGNRDITGCTICNIRCKRLTDKDFKLEGNLPSTPDRVIDENVDF